MADQFTALIMAAGLGTRMRSDTPKVLHRVCGKPMVEWVIDAARGAGAGRIVCVVRPADGVAGALPREVEVAEQREGEGTAAAVLATGTMLKRQHDPVVVLSGDHPLVSSEQISELLRTHRAQGAAATILTTEELDPAGYGRIVRGAEGSIERIVETKQTEGVAADVLAVREINLGTYAFDPGALLDSLAEVAEHGGERYLTEAIQALHERGAKLATERTNDADVALGVNDRSDLMTAESVAQRRILEGHALAGVTFLHPGSVRVEHGVEIGADTAVAAGVSLLGATAIGAGCEIGPQSTISDSRVERGARIFHSYLVEAEVLEGASVGPFAHLRPGTIIGRGAKVGTFVEVKNSNVGAGAKVPHLSYLGDADVGERSNLGASTITANYDGRRKHRTTLGKSVKTGIHTSLVAPLDVGDGAYTGAGSVITDDVPEGALGVARSKQRNVEGYAQRVEEDPE